MKFIFIRFNGICSLKNLHIKKHNILREKREPKTLENSKLINKFYKNSEKIKSN